MSQRSDSIDSTVVVEIGRRWLHALTEGSLEIVALLDGSGRFRFLGGGVELVLGVDPVTLSRLGDLELIHDEDRARVVEAFRQLVLEEGARANVNYRVRHAAGHYVAVKSTAINRLADPVVGSVVVHTVARRQQFSGASETLASDQRVSDRRGFMDATQRLVERTQSHPGYGFSVLLVELDRHKMLVGSLGQELVDALLSMITERLVSLLRRPDKLGYLGGGEFVLLLDGIADRRQVARVAERIQHAVATQYRLGDRDISATVTVGIATSERVYERAEDVVRDAALAANRARADGRRKPAVYQTQMRVEDSRLLAMVSSLHAALQRGQLRLVYQPIVALGTRALVGFEALVRWQHPEHGLVSPDQFIPIAEESGMIIQLGDWVLREACRQMVEWNQKHGTATPLYISVNLSAKQVAEEDLVGQVERALKDSALDPHQLKLEVTETAVLENREMAAAAFERLKKLGIKVSLDDFGTGYSSFSYLHQLPYDTLKIDRSFVSRIGQDSESSEILHAIIVLAHNLRMDVVAEGVETAAQAAQLSNMWCEYGQGYYFSRPVDAETAGGMIERSSVWQPAPIAGG